MTSFATAKHGSVNSFDFDNDYSHPNIIEGDLMGSLNPSLANNVFQIVDHEDSGCSSHDSPSSCVSNSSDDGGYIGNNNQVEDFDLYDFGSVANGGADSLYDSFPSTNAQASKISNAQMNGLMVESYLKDFAHPSNKQQSQQQQQQQQTLKNTAVIAAMKQQTTPISYAHLTPQQIQEQLLFIQQQRAHLAAAAAAAAAQQYTAATYGAQMVPFANSFLAAYHQVPHMPPGFIHPHSSPTMSLPAPMDTPVAEDSPSYSSTKKESGSTSPTIVQEQQKEIATKQYSASKKKVSTAKRPRDVNVKSPTDEALSELESKKPATVEEDKELKRQRRLIKNRESAQASRERKKVYVKGLETRVEELSTENKSLNSKIQILEEENRRLHERLNLLDPSGLHIHDTLEPENKKRRLSKIMPPITKPMTTYNPFDLNFWTAFMSGYTNQQTAAQQLQHQMPAISSDQQTPWINPSAIDSKRVVMFIMLFCVAVMIIIPKDLTNSINATGSSSASTTTIPESANTASLPSSELTSPTLLNGRGRGVGRTLKTVSVDDGFSTRIKMMYDQFGRLMQSENATHTASSSTNTNTDMDPFSFSVELDKNTKSLVISLPLENKNIETKEKGLQQVLKTKGETKMETELKKESIETEKVDVSAPTVESLSLDMLREICRVVHI